MLQSLPLRTTAFAALMAVPATLAGATVAMAAEDVVFPIRNDTSATLLEFYISPTTDDSWGDNVVPPGGELLPGETVNMRVEEASEICIYDMYAVFSDDENVESYEVDICEIDTWVYSDN